MDTKKALPWSSFAAYAFVALVTWSVADLLLVWLVGGPRTALPTMVIGMAMGWSAARHEIGSQG